MKIFRRFFYTSQNSSQSGDFTGNPFGSTKEEIKAFLVGPGKVIYNTSSLEFSNYPFEPSIAFEKPNIGAEIICSVSLDRRPAIQVGDELIFISREDKEHLRQFTTVNDIRIIERSWVWNWIVEPFLDTEFTKEDQLRLDGLLLNYGLDGKKVEALKEEVKEQMLKYNFDTMLWEWVDLDLFDLLSAMRVKYDKEKFRSFYWEAMRIALLEKSPK